MALVVVGCETDSFLDPSVVGRWERTPVVLPILDRLDVIEETGNEIPGLSQVRAEDLVPDVREYIVGPGDLLTVTVFELIVPNVESVQTRRVDELGMIRLPVIGPIRAQGMTASRLEKHIGEILENKGVLKDPTVSVIVQEGRQNTFSVIGEPSVAGTAIGTYTILHNDFRLLDAMALARGVPGRTKKLFIIRQAAMTPTSAELPVPFDAAEPTAAPSQEVPRDPAKLIEDLMKGMDQPSPAPTQAPQTQPQSRVADTPLPPGLEAGIDQPTQPDQWVNVDGKWMRVDQPAQQSIGRIPGEATEAPAITIAQRVIEIPYQRLMDGDMRYNVVIRPGDIIRVPPPAVGNVYIMGAISRPGTFQVPGDQELTLKNLVAAAGGLSPLAWPERVDLIRRIGDNQEGTVRVNIRAIFNGTQPDFFLKPNDQINVGTSFIATPLAVIRNGFRASYGFGFILDRNFGPEVFGPEPTNE